MGDLTRRAEAAIYDPGTEQVLTPEECLAYIKTPSNFQSFAAYVERLIHEKKIDLGGNPISDYLIQIVTEVDPDTDKSEKRRITRFIRGAWEKDEKGNYPTTLNIRRDIALKMCFALGLNEAETNDFLRKACSMYGLNVRDPQEACCFYCILAKKPYVKAKELLHKYEMFPASEEDITSDKGTQTLRGEVRNLYVESEDEFLEKFLLKNKASFTRYSRTLVRDYLELRTSLCKMIIESHLDLQSMADEETPPELDAPYKYIISAARSIADHDGAFSEVAEELEHGSDKVTAFSDFQDLITEEYEMVPDELVQRLYEATYSSSDPVSGEEFIAHIINEAVSDDLIFNEILWGVPYNWNRGNQTGPAAYGQSSISGVNTSFLSNFPKADYLSSITEGPKDRDGNENYARKRKILMLFFFMNYFYSWLVAHDAIDIDDAEAKRRFDNFYTGLNDTLADCNMVCAYLADPYDWLILKSAASYLKLDEDSDPVEFFNDVIRLSFDEDEIG